jgi:hypothetical protein
MAVAASVQCRLMVGAIDDDNAVAKQTAYICYT